MAAKPAEWDAEAYDRLAKPQEEWARQVLERLPLRADEVVLDAGCGSGGVTRMLLERLPRGRVIGVDGSRAMIDQARSNLEQWGDQVELRVGDLQQLELEEPVDAVFSNATFHWVPDHPKLFRRLREAMKPGAPLVAQCGGEGNVAEFAAAIEETSALPEFAPAFEGFSTPYNFAGPAVTEERLRAAGFDGVRCWLEDRRVEPDDPRAFGAAAGLAPHLERLPEEQRDRFVDAVMERLAKPIVYRYVRLNIDARAA
ncbi:MAG TPA: methyltransferase domain-containing protein [Solirubrobacterales bacterium]|nr:methyltransferase domain-containing protein [Solirubrobacterales bacterium]